MCVAMPNFVPIGQTVADIFHQIAETPPLGDRFKLWHARDVTHAKYCDSRFGRFGVLIPLIMLFAIRRSPLQQCKHYRATL